MSDATEPTESEESPVIKRAREIEYAPVTAAAGLKKGVLLDESDGTPTVSLRRFELAGGSEVPRHTNALEHEQYVLSGEYVVGIDDEEHVVTSGDAVHVPAGAEHWYRNESEEPGEFLCVVPNGDDTIELVD